MRKLKPVIMVVAVVLALYAFISLYNYSQRPPGAVLLSKHYHYAQWSEDGKWLYYNSGGSVRRYNTRTRKSESGSPSYDNTSNLSPDGKYVHDRSKLTGVALMELSSGTSRTILHAPTSAGELHWLSHDRILVHLEGYGYSSSSEVFWHNGAEIPAECIITLRVDGSGLKVVAPKGAYIRSYASDGSGFIYIIKSDEDTPDTHYHYYNLRTGKNKVLPFDKLEEAEERYLDRFRYMDKDVVIYDSHDIHEYRNTYVVVRSLKNAKYTTIVLPGYDMLVDAPTDIVISPDLQSYYLKRSRGSGSFKRPSELWVLPMPVETLKKIREIGADGGDK